MKTASEIQSRVMSKHEKTIRCAEFWTMAYCENLRCRADATSESAAAAASVALAEFRKQVFSK